jgi:hypothetical protein
MDDSKESDATALFSSAVLQELLGSTLQQSRNIHEQPCKQHDIEWTMSFLQSFLNSSSHAR